MKNTFKYQVFCTIAGVWHVQKNINGVWETCHTSTLKNSLGLEDCQDWIRKDSKNED